jgi:ribonucleoside-diphosphate reductase alpha chain
LTSTEIAAEKGSFKQFDKNKFVKGGFIQTLPKEIHQAIKKNGIRNSLLLMQAPTGSTSLMSNTSSGIEPVYEFEFVRRDRLGEHVMRHHLYEEWYKNHKEDIDSGKLQRPEWFVSANDLSPEDHVIVQGYIQRYVDASISKTVNAPNSHTIEDVKKVYSLAYEQGLKGIAYMRDGSEEPKKEEVVQTTIQQPQLPVVKPRPMVVHGSTYKIDTPVGTAYITVNCNGDNEPLEVFINVGKPGADVYAMAEALGRMISMSLRIASYLPPRERIKKIIDELQGIGGGRAMGFGKDRIRSLPDAVAKVLVMHFEKLYADDQATPTNGNGLTNGHGKEAQLVSQMEQPSLMPAPAVVQAPARKAMHFDICPSCGEAMLAREEGCAKCYGCGHAEC